MQINTKLKSLSWIAAVMAILIVIILVWTGEQLKQAKAQRYLAGEMLAIHNNRIALRDEYILNYNERPKEQWLQQTEKLKKLVERAQAEVVLPEQKVILQQISLHLDKTKKHFTALVGNQDKIGARRISIAQSQKMQQLIYSQIIIEAHELLKQIIKLQMLSEREYAARQSQSNFLILFSVLLLACFTIGSSMFIARSIADPIKRLRDGLKVIGDGNLDYQIAAAGDDELADLAHASNEMAAKLKQSHTSLDNLRMEMVERVKAQENMRESEDKFKYMFDSSVVGKSITLVNGKVNVNKAFCDMLGYSVDELNQIRWPDITHPDDVKLTQKEIDQILSGKNESTRFVKRFIHKNGSAVWVDLSSSLRRDKDGNPLYFMSITVDITERMRAEEEIRRLNVELEQRVIERTTELSVRTNELERINKVFVDRELRMRELKARIAEMEKQKK